MSIRFVILIIACGMALAQNIDEHHGRKMDSAFESHQTPLPPDGVVNLLSAHKSVHRRESSGTATEDALCEKGSRAIDLTFNDGSQHANKRSLDNKPGKVAEPGCCG